MKKLCLLIISSLLLTMPPTSYGEGDTADIKQRIISMQQKLRKDLINGDINHAKHMLAQASGNFHSVEIELGLIQTLMQAGEYRHALSAAAHTQAEHTENSDASLCYAWLLAIGGQKQPALQLLNLQLHNLTQTENNRNNLVDIEAITRLRDQLNSNAHPLPPKTSDAIQLKPFTDANKYPLTNMILLNTGILIDNGNRLVTTIANYSENKKYYVRNGLGETTTAEFAKAENEIIYLKLHTSFQRAKGISRVTSKPIPGRPIYIISLRPSLNLEPSWPQLSIDILGPPADTMTAGYRIHTKNLTAGAGVYNQHGNLIGLIAESPQQTMLPLLDGSRENNPSATTTTNAFSGLSQAEIYESALANTVEVFGEGL